MHYEKNQFSRWGSRIDLDAVYIRRGDYPWHRPGY